MFGGEKSRHEYHIPVMVQEVVSYLLWNPDGTYVDCTFGTGGHALAILRGLSIGGRLIGIDKDQEALEVGRHRLGERDERVQLAVGNFAQLDQILQSLEADNIDGVFLDLGVSSLQLDRPNRGFSFSASGPLDMRMDRRQSLTAAELLDEIDVCRLANLLREGADEPRPRRLAEAILRARSEGRLSTTSDLADVVSFVSCRRREGPEKRLSRVFQAIRMAVNNEIPALEAVLDHTLRWLTAEGRLVVLSYHSGEDRVVKRFMARESRDCVCPPGVPQCVCGHKAKIETLTKRPIRSGPNEIEDNPRARSARLRAARRLN